MHYLASRMHYHYQVDNKLQPKSLISARYQAPHTAPQTSPTRDSPTRPPTPRRRVGARAVPLRSESSPRVASRMTQLSVHSTQSDRDPLNPTGQAEVARDCGVPHHSSTAHLDHSVVIATRRAPQISGQNPLLSGQIIGATNTQLDIYLALPPALSGILKTC